MEASANHRRSRWDRAPVLDGRGRQKHAQLTERDIEIFKLLGRYRYLSIDDIHAFVGGSRKGLAHHVNLLSRQPNLYLNRPPQQRQSADANYRPLIYELDRRGVAVLRELGLPAISKEYHRNFTHALLVSRIMASIELGVLARPGLRLVNWDEIVVSGKTPHATVTSARPTHIPVSITFAGKEYKTEINADGKPFGIEYRGPGPQPTYRFFPGVEADLGTEPLQASDIERSSIAKKLLAYLAIEQSQNYRAHFGFPNLFVPFVTGGTTRLRSMMALLAKLTEGRGSRSILFKTFDATASRPTLSESILSSAWERVGFEPLNLSAQS
jgi:hypothetical protein